MNYFFDMKMDTPDTTDEDGISVDIMELAWLYTVNVGTTRGTYSVYPDMHQIINGDKQSL